MHCPVWQLEPNKWYFKDEFNFLIYCIWMGNIIGFILNIKFANVTYCTREWKEILNFFQKCVAFRPSVLGMCMHSLEGVVSPTWNKTFRGKWYCKFPKRIIKNNLMIRTILKESRNLAVSHLCPVCLGQHVSKQWWLIYLHTSSQTNSENL